MDWLDYREKLGIGFDDEQKTTMFTNKIFNILNLILSSGESRYQISNEEYIEFCNMTGTIVNRSLYSGDGFGFIMKVLERHTNKVSDFVSYYIAFLNCQKDNENKPWKRAHLKDVLMKMLSEAHIPYELLEDVDGFFVFPKGVEELDKALVSQPLTWLAKYPNSEKAWIKALKQYSDATPTDASDVADLFRKALETFIQEFFSNAKSLET